MYRLLVVLVVVMIGSPAVALIVDCWSGCQTGYADLDVNGLPRPLRYDFWTQAFECDLQDVSVYTTSDFQDDVDYLSGENDELVALGMSRYFNPIVDEMADSNWNMEFMPRDDLCIFYPGGRWAECCSDRYYETILHK